MAEITKKVYAQYFDKILKGEKTYEVRLADFNVAPGDTLLLLEIDEARKFTGRELRVEVTYAFNTKSMEAWHPKEEIEKYGLCVMSIRRC